MLLGDSCIGKTAIIIGATSDIGEDTTKRFFDQKIGHLILTGRNEKNLKKLKEKYSNETTKCDAISIDFSTSEGISSFPAKMKEIENPKIDFYLFCPGTCGEEDPVSYLRVKEDIMKVANVNLMSAIVTVESLNFNENAALVFVSSTNSFHPLECGTGYCTTKAGLTEFAKSKAFELGSRGIRVNTVAPGLIATKFHDAYFDSKEEVEEFLKNHEEDTALGRNASIKGVGNTIEFLFSPLANDITGTQIVIDCGETLVEKADCGSDDDEEDEEEEDIE